MKKSLRTLFSALLIAGLPLLTVSAQNVGDAAPDFTLDNVDGGEFTLSDQIGKVVFIFFFGNGCPHCLANGPNTQTDIYEIFKDNPNFVAVGIDTWNGNSSAVQGYRASTNIEYLMLLQGSQVVKDYGSTYDRIVIIDQEGKIQYKSTTNADKATTATAAAKLEELLGGASSLFESQSDVETFVLAPNVVRNDLLIPSTFESTVNVQARIIDVNGKIVWSQQIISEGTRLDVSNLSPGYYTILLNESNEFRTARFIKVQ